MTLENVSYVELEVAAAEPVEEDTTGASWNSAAWDDIFAVSDETLGDEVEE